ncbi:hypothetical protein MP228_002437 [Amoeboaphelidium protococcarum]|nr:hypothetical protein MP228_002437 [Amoeboaphelidium protococcarum]
MAQVQDNNKQDGKNVLSFLMSIPFDELNDMQLIGQGSYGQVFKADYLGTEVAVKMFHHQLTDTTSQSSQEFDFKKYLGREIDMLKESRHPNIVQFMGTAVNDYKIYIVTEFVPSGNLVRWVNEESKMLADSVHDEMTMLSSYRMRLSFAIDIARAIAYLHSKGIIHRDLKLENLLLTENRRVKVCDFGFSRIIDEFASAGSGQSKLAVPANNNRRDRKLSFCGTDGYMAPEIILCMDNYDMSVDVFSFGIIVIALLILKVPATEVAETQEIFQRVVPGFGINMELVEKDLVKYFEQNGFDKASVASVKNVIKIVGQMLDEDASKRASLKSIMTVLKEAESECLVKLLQIKDSEQRNKNTSISIINAGIFSGGDSSKMGASDQEIDRNSSVDLYASSNRNSNHALFSGASANDQSQKQKPSAYLSNASLSSDQQNFRFRHEIPHRFSIINTAFTAKHQTPSNLASSGSSKRESPCDVCKKPVKSLIFGGHLHHLQCDDCGFLCHKKCGKSAPASCGMALIDQETLGQISRGDFSTLERAAAQQKRVSVQSKAKHGKVDDHSKPKQPQLQSVQQADPNRKRVDSEIAKGMSNFDVGSLVDMAQPKPKVAVDTKVHFVDVQWPTSPDIGNVFDMSNTDYSQDTPKQQR